MLFLIVVAETPAEVVAAADEAIVLLDVGNHAVELAAVVAFDVTHEAGSGNVGPADFG